MAISPIALQWGTPASLTISLNSLASAALVVSSNIALADGLDVIVEFVINAGTVAGNKQALVYAVSSFDGTNFSDSVNRDNMAPMGAIALPASGSYRSRSFSVGAPFSTPPPHVRIVVYNDSGAAFAGSGNSAQYQLVNGIITTA